MYNRPQGPTPIIESDGFKRLLSYLSFDDLYIMYRNLDNEGFSDPEYRMRQLSFETEFVTEGEWGQEPLLNLSEIEDEFRDLFPEIGIGGIVTQQTDFYEAPGS